MRKWIVHLHGLAGIVVGALLIVIALTGSVLVFRDDIEVALYPELWRVTAQDHPRPLSSLLAAVEQAYPADRLFAIRMPATRDRAVVIWLNDEEGRRVYVDPYSGRILGAHLPVQTVTGLLFLLHTSLLAGEAGETINGLGALMLLGLVATGIVLWWPGLRALRSGLTIRRSNQTAKTHDLHKVTGIATAAVLLVISATGAALVFYAPFQHVIAALTETPTRPVLRSPPQSTARVPLDVVVQAGEAALPDATTTWIILPAAPDGIITVRKRFAEEWHPNGRSFVWLDQYSGQALGVENALQASVGRRIDNLLYPLHIGRFAGIGSQALYLLAGLSPAILAVTGWSMWQRRRNR